jgi:ABC-2 type transport system permease protein
MKALRAVAWAFLKIYMREPVVLFFLYAFPSMLLILFGTIFGNKMPPTGRMRAGYIDLQVPALAVMAMGTVAFQQIPSSIAARREAGVLRTLRSQHLSTALYVGADLLVHLLMVTINLLLMVGLGRGLFRMRFAGSVGAVAVGLVFCAVTLFSLGYMLAGVIPSARMAAAIGNSLFFPMLFLSGIAIPLSTMPAKVGRVGGWSPMGHAVRIMQGLWTGQSWAELQTSLIVLAVFMVISIAVTLKAFRWR